MRARGSPEGPAPLYLLRQGKRVRRMEWLPWDADVGRTQLVAASSKESWDPSYCGHD